MYSSTNLKNLNVNSKPVQIEFQGRLIRYICPKCHQVIQFYKKYQGKSLCMNCGQRLEWKPAEDICIEVIQTEDSDEAAWIAKEYYSANGMKEEDYLNIDNWRRALRGDGAELYLLFRNQKAHGKFMRKYAKEGIIHDG